MILENLLLFLKLYVRPLAAISGLVDEGSWLLSLLAALTVTLALQASLAPALVVTVPARLAPRRAPIARMDFQQPRAPQPGAAQPGGDESDEYDGESGDEDEYDYGPPVPRQQVVVPPRVAFWLGAFLPLRASEALTTVIALLLLFVPATILAVVLMARVGSFGVVFRRDYAAMLTCTYMAWAAAFLPVAILVAASGAGAGGRPSNAASVALGAWACGLVYFAVLMTCVVRTVVGVDFPRAAAAVLLAWPATLLRSFLLILASPFLLYWLYAFVRGDIGDVSSQFSQRQNFRRSLQAATVNPRDAEAHYQLGLIHQQRRQYAEAIERFTRSIEIDRREVDAHYQLGRIAREQGRLQDAIGNFSAVVELDDKHAQSEIWREIGATYAAAGMDAEARDALERFVERRAYDPEGLFYLGENYERRGEADKARELFARCVEAADTAPYYQRSAARRWGKLARARMAK